MLRLFIKEITLITCTIYTLYRLINISLLKNSFFLIKHILLVTVLTGISIFSDIFLHSNTVTIQLLLTFVPFAIITSTSLEFSFVNTIISYGISYINLIISAIFTSIVFAVLKINLQTDLSYIQFFTAICQFLLIFCLFKIKRFKKGMPFLFKRENNLILYICILTLFTYILLSNNNGESIYILPVILVILFAIFLFISWKKQINNDYLWKVFARRSNILEDEIQNQSARISELEYDLERLSKLVHKDNKLIPAMELTITQYLKTFEPFIESSPSKEKGQALLNDLKNISQDRNGILSGYEISTQKIITTNIVSIDALMNYMLTRAKNEEIQFELAGGSNISNLIKNIISETDLNTLLADLVENAIIATSKSNSKNILINIGIADEGYYINIFDSGIPFSFNVLKSFGKRRITTYKDTHGSGIGLMTTYELLKKYKATYILEEYDHNNIFTKKISIKFDSRKDFAIYSYRAIELSKHVKRANFQISPIDPY